jgi:extradiol dioxygenase family protein
MVMRSRWLASTLMTLSPLSCTNAAAPFVSRLLIAAQQSSKPAGKTSLTSSTVARSFSVRGGAGTEVTAYTTLADPAPGSPFHYAFPVHNLEAAKDFYENVLGCVEGRSSEKWQDYSLHGHQIVAHWAGNDYRCQDYYNPVDGDEVPVPHVGLALTVEQFHELAERVRSKGVNFIIEPHLRFKGMPGEQYTMFFKDPSGNNLEFKAMTHPENLFAKYNVTNK